MQIEYLMVSAVIALGAFTQGLTGFGLALVSVPLLSLVVDVKIAVPVAGVFGWLVTFPAVWKMRKHVQWNTGFILLAGSLPGSFVGASLLKHLPAEIILISMGSVLLISSLYALSSKKAVLNRATTSLTIGIGFFSGALGSSVGEPGPPVIAYTSMQNWNSDQAKSTLSFFFMITMIGALAGFWHQELLTNDVQLHVLKAMPAFIIGMCSGMFFYSQLNRLKIDYHKIIHGMLTVIASMLILKNISI